MLYTYIFRNINRTVVSTVFRTRFFSNFITKMNSKKSNELYLTHEGDSERFQATFNWTNQTLNIDREFNFNRGMQEKLKEFLGRIKINVEKIVSNKAKRKRKKENVEEGNNFIGEVNVSVFYGCTEISNDSICEEVFFSDLYDKDKLTLKVLDTSYRVVVNSPWVVKLALPSSIMVGFPIYPSVDIKFGNKFDSKFTWYKMCKTSNNWIEIRQGLVYTPVVEEIGQKLKLTCVPSNGKVFGPELTAEAFNVVETGPGICPFHARHAFTKEIQPDERFRVVSYNILADLYAETDVAKNELFHYCPPHALCIDYRKQLYLQEILGYNADIICLQEVDVKVFENELQDILGQQKLHGLLTRKGSTVAEGVATFYSTEKFRMKESKVLELGNEIDINPIFKSIWKTVKKKQNLIERFKERCTVLQLQILESLWNPKEKIIVGNTHLFFHPDADHIRLLQAGMILIFLEDVSKTLKMLYPNDRISLIMCGDFNSTPDSGIYHYMTKNYVPADISDWRSKEGEEVEGLELRHPFTIDSACGTPKFTNYTVGFADCLDYIYYEKNKLNVLQVVPFPDEELLKANSALPSVKFPSDHLALIADFEWKS